MNETIRHTLTAFTTALLVASLVMLHGLGRRTQGAEPPPAGRIVNPSFAERQPATSHVVPLPSSYVELYRQVVARHSSERHGSLFETLSVGEAALRLWRQTKEPACLATAQRCFEAAFEHGKPDLRDFHLLMAFARLARLLKQEGHLRPDLAGQVGEIAESQLRAFIRSADNSDNNIRIAQVLAYACLLQCRDGMAYPDREAARSAWTSIGRSGGKRAISTRTRRITTAWEWPCSWKWPASRGARTT